jgi:hypothetical protein
VSSSLKKYTYKSRFLNETLSEIEEICVVAKQEFFNEIRQLHSDLNVYDEALDGAYANSNVAAPPKDHIEETQSDAEFESQEANDDLADTSLKKVHPNWVKKVYRAITLKTHPDKLLQLSKEEKERKVKIYTQTITAYSNHNYSDIVLTAIDLDIKLPNSQEVITILKEKCKEVEIEIEKLKLSLEWIWHHSDLAERKEIIRKFVHARGWTAPGAAMKKSRDTNHPGKSLAWARKKIEQSDV